VDAGDECEVLGCNRFGLVRTGSARPWDDVHQEAGRIAGRAEHVRHGHTELACRGEHPRLVSKAVPGAREPGLAAQERDGAARARRVVHFVRHVRGATRRRRYEVHPFEVEAVTDRSGEVRIVHAVYPAGLSAQNSRHVA
jgi:hypothetical protein